MSVTLLDNATINFNVIKAVLEIFSTCQGDQEQSCQRQLVQQPFLPRQRLSSLWSPRPSGRTWNRTLVSHSYNCQLATGSKITSDSSADNPPSSSRGDSRRVSAPSESRGWPWGRFGQGRSHCWWEKVWLKTGEIRWMRICWKKEQVQLTWTWPRRRCCHW